MPQITHRKGKKLSNILFNYAYFFICLLVVSLSYLFIVENASKDQAVGHCLYIALLGILVLAISLYLFFSRSKDRSQLFLIIVIPIGLTFAFFILPTDIPDETVHIFRALTVFTDDGSHMVIPNDANFNFASSHIPYGDFYSLLTSNTDWETTFEVPRDMSSYLGIQYYASGIGILVAKSLGANIWISIYAGRIVNLIIFCITGYYLLRIVPYGKTAILIFLLNPMLIQQEASISADAICNICAFLYITFLIKAYLEDNNRKRNILLMIVFAFLLCRCKVGGYIPLCLLMLVFIFKIKSKKQRLIAIASTIFIGIIGYIYIVYIYNGSLVPEARELMRDPRNLATVLINTADKYGVDLIKQYNGAFLGALDIALSKKFYLVYFVLQVIVILVQAQKININLHAKEKTLLVIACIIELFAIFMTQVWWSQQKGEFDAIQGVQGRYFIPIVFMLLFCFCRTQGNILQSEIVRPIIQTIQGFLTRLPNRIENIIKCYSTDILIVIVMGYIYAGDIMAIFHHFGI